MVAERIPEVSLGLMMYDPEAEVRRVVAERIDPNEAINMLDDHDWNVRLFAAMRVPAEVLEKLRDDPDQEVREVVSQRLEQLKMV